METITEEVNSESSQNSAHSQTQEDGNVSMAEFADQLLKRRQTEEPEPESSLETDEPADQPAEPTEVSEEQPAEEIEATEETSEQTQPQDVLNKFNIDLDSLSEEESRQLAKSLNASAIKRFGVLTAQKNALLAENAELQEKAQQPVNAEVPQFLKDNALYNITDENGLTKEVENLTTLIEWAEEGLDNEAQYDDNGDEYLVKDGDKVYGKTELKRIRNNAKKILRKDAPARQAWIKERTASDQQALQTFQFLGEPESEDYKLFMQVKASPLYKPLVDHLPNSNFALGLMVEGLKTVQARQAQASKPKPKPKAPVASMEAGSSRPKTPQAKKNKEVDAAKRKFDASGSMADYQNYIRIKRATAK